MSQHETPDILEQAIKATQAIPIPADPPTDLIASTLAAVQNRMVKMPLVVNPERRRDKIGRYIRYGSIASAAVAAAVIIGLIWIGNGSAAAFEKAVENVQKAAAVRYQVRTKSELADQLDEVTIRGKQVRVELVEYPKLTWIIDWEIAGMLILNPPARTWQSVDLAAKTGVIGPFDTMALSVREQLEELVKQKPTLEVTETIDGVSLDRYSVHGRALGLTGDWLIWLDRDSMFPVRIHFESTLHGKKLSREYSHFDWNPRIASDAFSFDPPGDYREETIFRTIPPLTPLPKKK